jgi:hypothetical protein
MQAIYEWSIEPPPGGLVSVVVRFDRAEGSVLAGLSGDPAALKAAVADAVEAEMITAAADGRFPGATE